MCEFYSCKLFESSAGRTLYKSVLISLFLCTIIYNNITTNNIINTCRKWLCTPFTGVFKWTQPRASTATPYRSLQRYWSTNPAAFVVKLPESSLIWRCHLRARRLPVAVAVSHSWWGFWETLIASSELRVQLHSWGMYAQCHCVSITIANPKIAL